MHDAVEVDEYEKRCQLREDRDRPGACGIRTAGPRRRHLHSLDRTSRADLHRADPRFSSFSGKGGRGVQCPVSPAILLLRLAIGPRLAHLASPGAPSARLAARAPSSSSSPRPSVSVAHLRAFVREARVTTTIRPEQWPTTTTTALSRSVSRRRTTGGTTARIGGSSRSRTRPPRRVRRESNPRGKIRTDPVPRAIRKIEGFARADKSSLARPFSLEVPRSWSLCPGP